MSSVTILSDDVIKNLLHHLQPHELAPIIDSLKRTFEEYSIQSTPDAENESHYQPERAVVTRPSGQKTLFMPATSKQHVGAKIVGVPPADAKGKTLTGVVVLCDAEGAPVGFLNSQELTAFRTALGSMPLLQLRREVTNVVVFGAGKQAFWHVRLALLLRLGEVKSITIINRSRERSDELVAQLNPYAGPGVKLTCFEAAAEQREDQLKHLVTSAHVIFCTTPAKKPLFPGSCLEAVVGQEKGPYIAAIGSYHESMSELDPQLFSKIASQDLVGKIVVDSRSGCLSEAGEIIQANMKGESLYEIGYLLHHLKQENNEARRKWLSSGFTVYKSVGMGVMDLAVGGAILELAKSKNVGSTATI